MNNGKKRQKKRKRQSPPFISQIAIRLEKLRNKRRDLWDDDDDDDEQSKSKKTKTHKSVMILSDSDDERPSSSSKRRHRNIKSKENHIKNARCLICSILSQLSSNNCCSEHLSILKNHSHQQTTNSQWLSEQVMILPITNDIVQHYLDPQQIHHLRTQTSTSSSSNKKILTKKSLNKLTMALNLSESEQTTRKSSQTDAQPLTSTIVVESARSNSATVPPDITTSPGNNDENINTIDIDPPVEIITIDDTQKEDTLIKSNNNNKQIDPWIPISDEIDAALEQALDKIDSLSNISIEFTPATARRTETETMAACLPKIPLKQGRFRLGKPIIDRTTSNAANEYRPLAAAQSSPATSSVITINVHSSPTTTNVETESNRVENIINNSDNNIFTQDETCRLPITTETNDMEIESNQSNQIQHVTSSNTNDTTTPSRISYRMNPDGTRVSISRPPLPTNHQSPSRNSLRRTSTDVTPIRPNTRQV